VRLFFAVELPPEVQAALGRLKPRDDDRAYRWSDPSLLHVTLAFLGEQPSERLETLERVGSSVAAASRPGVLRLGEAGSFGTRRAPRVLWVGLGGDLAALNRLQASLVAALREQGVQLDEGDYRPHITLARRREGAVGPAPWPPRSPLRALAIPVSRLTLFESRLSSRGPTYIPVQRWPLTG
jgi:2'-5' RNA ligase